MCSLSRAPIHHRTPDIHAALLQVILLSSSKGIPCDTRGMVSKSENRNPFISKSPIAKLFYKLPEFRSVPRVRRSGRGSTQIFQGRQVEGEPFGFNIAISDADNAVITTGLDHDGVFRNEGAVHVFQCTRGVWIQQAKRLSRPGQPNFFESWGIGISGDTIAAGHLGNIAN